MAGRNCFIFFNDFEEIQKDHVITQNTKMQQKFGQAS
jgi:hypothetical protein